MPDRDGETGEALEGIRVVAGPPRLTWKRGLALLLAAGALWFLSITTTTIFLEVFGRP